MPIQSTPNHSQPSQLTPIQLFRAKLTDVQAAHVAEGAALAKLDAVAKTLEAGTKTSVADVLTARQAGIAHRVQTLAMQRSGMQDLEDLVLAAAQ